ncbi:MAG: hypothetical protein HY852_23655 [Bradyrhizobium sp.]|uniref:hypothetical protein n=1 Tax=Bradyrhizobium sp. TaxID=376 RepID=UPI0025C1702C|nr:hypothetical protein [Bradyrhizobium sp.]MBI5264803.1 hypothetical protein [Bradyrhizobium sp.]
MRASINDQFAIGAIRPLNAIGYLRAHGWERFGDASGLPFTVWHNASHPKAEILIPSDRSAADYTLLLREALLELEAVENRSQLEILRDLYNSGFDVVRLAAQSTRTADGTVDIDEGVLLFERARDTLYAAACSTVKPQAVFHSRRPQAANEYMRKARLGQTEQGSYVLTLLSPVAPQLTPHSDTDLFPEEPFERRVVQTLARSVRLAVGAAESSVTGPAPDFSPFQNAVAGGVSANLCEGIAGLFSAADPATVELSISWALNRPTPNEAHSRVLISSDVIPTLQEAARLFRAFDRLENYEIKGPVIKLQRDQTAPFGMVTVLAPVEGRTRKVTLVLPDRDYQTAVVAHHQHRYVRVVGTVAREAKTYRLENPVNFDLAPDDEDEVEVD